MERILPFYPPSTPPTLPLLISQVRASRRNASLNGLSDRFAVLQCGAGIDDQEPMEQVWECVESPAGYWDGYYPLSWYCIFVS